MSESVTGGRTTEREDPVRIYVRGIHYVGWQWVIDLYDEGEVFFSESYDTEELAWKAARSEVRKRFGDLIEAQQTSI